MLGTFGKFLFKCRSLSYPSIWLVIFLARALSHQEVNVKFLGILSEITLTVLKVSSIVRFPWKSQNSRLHKALENLAALTVKLPDVCLVDRDRHFS